MNQTKYCLEIWGIDYDKIIQTCLLAEDLGYYGFFYGESLTNIDLDCWTVLSTLIPLTKIIKLGPVITYIIPEYRSLPLLAKQCITFQDVSDGRLELRTGAGATLQYSYSWWHPYGITYPLSNKRVSILEDGIQLLWKYLGKTDPIKDETCDCRFEDIVTNSGYTDVERQTVYHNGIFFKSLGSFMSKPKINIPITIAAKSNRMMQIAAKYADIWESSYLSPDEFSLKNREFTEMLKLKSDSQVKLEKSTLNPKRSIELDVIIADSVQELEYKKKILKKERGYSGYNQILNKGLVGTPSEIKTRVQKYINLGIEQFLLAFQDPFDVKSIELFINTVERI